MTYMEGTWGFGGGAGVTGHEAVAHFVWLLTHTHTLQNIKKTVINIKLP